jgi:signal transduction histidine kinase
MKRFCGRKKSRIEGLGTKKRDREGSRPASQGIDSLAFIQLQESDNRLGVQVKELSARVERVTRELEAFTYSVSHDLRAPLRAIDGFSKILLEDFGEKLEPEARRLLGVIRSNAEIMDELIQGVVALSRVERAYIQREDVDTLLLVKEVCHSLEDARSRGEVKISVGELPPLFCDRKLLRQVWMHLISNAIKFTSKSPVRSVEIGHRLDGGVATFFVKDTGAGFDATYAGKLFGPFRRLHGAGEFEGSGMGLAIVRSIIERHGGRVWAEGEVDAGATFYFSLPTRGA